MRPPARPRTPARAPGAPPPRAAGDERAPDQERGAVAERAQAGPPAPPARRVPASPAVGERSADVRRAGGPGAARAASRPVVSHGVEERLAERRAMARRRRTRVVAAWAGGVVLVAAVVWALLWSPLLALDADAVSVQVAGGDGAGRYVDTDQVVDLARADVGVPLPRIDTVGLREDVRQLRGVADARVVRDWPRGVEVTVRPRVPVAAVPSGGDVVLLDAGGATVATVPKSPGDVPEVTVPLEVGAGGVRGADAAATRALRSVLVVLDAIPPSMLDDVRQVGAKTQDAVTMTMRDGVTIEWGSDQDVDLKVRVLDVLRADPSTDGVRVFDVSAPAAPITR
ncbi:cell division protein FtsQ/DivIB [Cellulomonas sp. PhB143]|uniref:cell division protein FtsQ/DivIB n=1 Tax=Cellulomonas sp. PhB143 TaxID=2485186 RepID=UPI000F48AD3E|nr:cell division protein FtsQ/DivIB [Cellulomonas sp. PhB143]ROS77215.1 cell division protein FtsQ [Cellulomonas sp. PhB143]